MPEVLFFPESDSCSKTDLTKAARDRTKSIKEKKQQGEGESDKTVKQFSESDCKTGECTDSSSGGNSKQGEVFKYLVLSFQR